MLVDSQETIYKAVGKRKTSIAKVSLQKGLGNIIVNNKDFSEYFFALSDEKNRIKIPLAATSISSEYDAQIEVKGGGISSQLDAICLGLSKAICLIPGDHRNLLKKKMLLRRDARIKERRKYGLRKARKAPQYSKR